MLLRAKRIVGELLYALDLCIHTSILERWFWPLKR